MLGICLHVTFAVDQKNCSTSLKLNSVSSFWVSRHWNKGMQVELEGRPWPCNGIRSLLSRHHCHAQHMLLSCCFYCYHKSYRQNIMMIINYIITTSCRHNSVPVSLDLISLGDLSIGAKHHLHYHLPSHQHEKASHSHHSLWPTIIRPSLSEDCFPMASTSLPRSVVLWPLYFRHGAKSLWYFDICSAGVFLSRLNSMPLDIKIYLVRFPYALAKKDLFSSRSYESFEFEFACSRISPL